MPLLVQICGHGCRRGRSPMAMVHPSFRRVKRPSWGTLENFSTQMSFSTPIRTLARAPLFTARTYGGS